MALTLVVARVSQMAIARQPCRFVATITNTAAVSVSLNSLGVSEVTKSGAIIEQPQFLTPNAGTGVMPSLSAGASLSVPFTIVPGSPSTPGPSPNNAPGGRAPGAQAMPARAVLNFMLSGRLSDGSTGEIPFSVSAISSVAPFPVPEGGAAQFGQGACSNLIAVFF